MSSGQELVERVHRLINGVAVAVPEETNQRRETAGPGDYPQSGRRTLAHIVKQGPLVIGVQPVEIDAQDASSLDDSQLVGMGVFPSLK